MQLVTTITEMQSLADSLRKGGKRIGFVPTMGFLHEGHLSLMRRAKQGADVVVASIFVNPTQFAPTEDLDRYPRDEKGDSAKCEAAGVDVLFLPKASEMYPEKPFVFVTVEGISDVLEGAIRPGHFRGVATVVAKLFHIVKPHEAFFGRKDYQQCAVLKQMVKELNLDVVLSLLPTVREADGLAMSSRNSYLTAEERRRAPAVFQALTEAERLFKSGVQELEKIKSEARAVLREAGGFELDYIELVDPRSLAPLASAISGMVIVIAVRLGRTRLIDNIQIL
jgi:pantoate--beta-alanine ligase